MKTTSRREYMAAARSIALAGTGGAIRSRCVHGKETNLKGLNLPLDVLNHIYHWNAARLVPEVRLSLEQSGL